MLSWLKLAWGFGSKVPMLLGGWQKLAIWAAVIVIAAGAIWTHGYVHGIEHGADKLGACRADLGRAQDGIGSLKAALAKQSAAVAALEAEGAKRQAAAIEALKAAKVGRDAAEAEADRLRHLKGSQASKVGPCPAAAALKEVRKGLR